MPSIKTIIRVEMYQHGGRAEFPDSGNDFRSKIITFEHQQERRLPLRANRFPLR